MKKKFIILLGMVLLVGCGFSKTIETQETTEVNQEKTSQYDGDKQDTVKPVFNEVDFSSNFNGITGGAIFYDPSKEQYDVYNLALCNEEKSPYSTFKIIITLMGLENQVVSLEKSIDANTTLEEAFRKSEVWYYRKIMDQLPKAYVKETLESLAYGNTDISVWQENKHNTFWIESSLKISPIGQVEVLSNIFEKENAFQQENLQILREIMFIEDPEGYSIYGKTGSALEKEAWFVGFFEKENNRTYFAVVLEDETQKLAGAKAKEIAINIIKNYYIKNLNTPS